VLYGAAFLLLGILLGGVILYGTRIANEAAQKTKQSISSNNNTNNKPSNISPTPVQNPITINTPKNHSVSLVDSTIVNGNTIANTPLSIITEKDNFIINSDKSGKFKSEINLIGGENVISISIPQNDSIYQSTTNLIYTTADLSQKKNLTQKTEINPDTEASPASQTAEILAQVKAAIKDNLNQTHSTLIGLAGSVNSLGDNTITLQDSETIWQITVNKQTTIVKNNANVKLKNIPLESKLIVIGRLTDKEVVSAIRIVLVNQKPPLKQRFPTLAKINKTELDSKTPSINITTHDQKKLKLNIDKDQIPNNKNIDNLQTGTTIFAIIESDLSSKKKISHTLLDFATIPDKAPTSP